MRILAGLLCGLLLAGCQGTPEMQGASPSSPASTVVRVETEASARAKAFTDLAAAYFNHGQMKIALDETRKAIQADNRYGPAYNMLGLIYMELAEDRLAEENFRKSIELDRADSETHNNYGWFLCTRERYEEGLAHFTEALRNPLYAQPERAMANAGLCNERKGDLKAAETHYNKALKLQPEMPLAIIKLAGLSFRQGKSNEAQRLLSRFSQVSLPTAESLWLGVRLERSLGDRDQAAAYALQLRRQFPDSDEAQRLMRGQYE